MNTNQKIAHLLRRTTFGPTPGAVERLAELGPDGATDSVLSNLTDLAAGTEPFVPSGNDNGDDDEALVSWWLARMADPRAGLHERMTWFWHGHFTSSLDKTNSTMMWAQHLLIRRHALGNFREMAKAVVEDAAMLTFLDGDGSEGTNPNENLARELMELFTLGRGNYTENDVKAAARGLSGYWVDWDTGEVEFDPESHYDRPVTFLGRRARYTATDIVDRICEQPACATHIARRLHTHLVGAPPSASEAERLARVFRDADLGILPLVEAIVRGDAFAGSIHNRYRTPVEWLLAASHALGAPASALDPWWLASLGQVPMAPPNVGGWPNDSRWVDGGQVLGHVGVVFELIDAGQVDTDVDPTVDAVLERCQLDSVSASTRAAMDQAAAAQSEYDYRLELLFTLALTSPEFSLA